MTPRKDLPNNSRLTGVEKKTYCQASRDHLLLWDFLQYVRIHQLIPIQRTCVSIGLFIGVDEVTVTYPEHLLHSPETEQQCPFGKNTGAGD